MTTPFLDLQHATLSFALGLARIGPALLFIPLFGDKALTSSVLRGVMLALVSLALLPTFESSAQALSSRPLLVTALKEATIGLVVGFTFGAPYLAALACGEMLDNQRGATIAKSIDPAAGVEASILAAFMGFLWTVTFALGGGVLRLMETLAASYRHLPLADSFALDLTTLTAAASVLGQALMAGILAASPAVGAMLLVEILLGVLSRFAPQLSPFSIALTVKSLIACLILVLYFGGWAFDFFNSIQMAWPVQRVFPEGS
ncbi:MAG: type III secretion system export apparatus subunit SctT [Burkholderiaceae bacterium]